MNGEAQSDAEITSPRCEFLRIAALIGVFAAQLILASHFAKAPPKYCFTRPFWLDEFHTLALVKEERADQLLLKLWRGADFNPPGLHLALWMVSKVTSVSDEVLLRSFSCAVGLCGFVATYFLLRLRFSWRVSWVGVLGMWSSSPHLVQQMFEGRTYSFWFASIAIFCLLLSVRAKGSWQLVCIAAVAALTCSIHYLAIIVLGLIAASQFCCNFRDVRLRWLLGVALAAGVITMIASLPLYSGQRAAVPVSTWIPAPTLGASVAFIEGYVVNYALAIPVLAYAIQALWARPPGNSSPQDGLDFKTYAGACGLILLPVALTVFSYVIQPVQLDRYAVPTALAYAPLIALVSSRLKRAVLEGMACLFFLFGMRGALVVYETRPDYRGAALELSDSSVERPLVVHWRVIAYPLFRYTDADPNVVRVSFLYRGDRLSRFDEWEQAVTRNMAELFELPKTIEPEELASRDEFNLLVIEGEEQRYKGFVAEHQVPVVGPLHWYKMRRAVAYSKDRKNEANLP